MKKALLLLIISISILNSNFAQSNIGIVKKIQGLYIFTDNEPMADYSVFGEISISQAEAQADVDIKSSMAHYQAVRDFLIKKTRMSNSFADGIILSLVDGGTDKAIIIKFKDNATNKDYAKVNRNKGLYTFVDCEPLSKYQNLGSISFKNTLSFSSNQYAGIRDVLIKKSLKEYNGANGVIIQLSRGSNNADAISLKD